MYWLGIGSVGGFALKQLGKVWRDVVWLAVRSSGGFALHWGKLNSMRVVDCCGIEYGEELPFQRL